MPQAQATQTNMANMDRLSRWSRRTWPAAPMLHRPLHLANPKARWQGQVAEERTWPGGKQPSQVFLFGPFFYPLISNISVNNAPFADYLFVKNMSCSMAKTVRVRVPEGICPRIGWQILPEPSCFWVNTIVSSGNALKPIQWNERDLIISHTIQIYNVISHYINIPSTNLEI